MAGNKNVYGERMRTPPGRFSYPHVFERAKAMEEGKEGKYETCLYIPKTSDISKLRAELEKVGKEAFGAKWKGLEKQAKSPLKDGDESDDPNAKGCWILKANSTRRPGVCDSKREPIDDKEQIYGGAWGRLSVTPASYEMKLSWGVKLFLNNVQKIRDDESFGGTRISAEEEFEEYADEAGADEDPPF